MIDVRRLFFTLMGLSLLLCLVSCVSMPPDSGAELPTRQESTAQVTEVITESKTEETTQSTTETQAAEEVTTYGELHFPESETN